MVYPGGHGDQSPPYSVNKKALKLFNYPQSLNALPFSNQNLLSLLSFWCLVEVETRHQKIRIAIMTASVEKALWPSI